MNSTSTTERRSVRRSERTAAITIPTVIMMGELPGPPGCRSSTSSMEISGSVSAAEFMPGSKKNSTGFRNSVKLHGTSAAMDAVNAIAALTKASLVRRTVARVRIAQTNRISHSAGAKARRSAKRRAVPAALLFVEPGVNIRTPERKANGKINAAKLVPNRPCASAPLIAGRSA